MAKSGTVRKEKAEDLAKALVRKEIGDFYTGKGVKVFDCGATKYDGFTKDTLILVAIEGIEIQVKIVAAKAIDGKPGTYGLE